MITGILIIICIVLAIATAIGLIVVAGYGLFYGTASLGVMIGALFNAVVQLFKKKDPSQKDMKSFERIYKKAESWSSFKKIINLKNAPIELEWYTERNGVYVTNILPVSKDHMTIYDIVGRHSNKGRGYERALRDKVEIKLKMDEDATPQVMKAFYVPKNLYLSMFKELPGEWIKGTTDKTWIVDEMGQLYYI